MNDESRATDDGTLSIKFQGNRVSTKDVIEVLETLEEILKDFEIAEIGALCSTLDIPPMIRDAVMYRLNENYVDRYYIEAVKPGSLEILPIIAASTFYVLKETLGESIKAGYLNSDIHGKLKEWITQRINQKMELLARQLSDHWRLQRLRPIVSLDEQHRSIEVTVPQRLLDEQRAPTLAQLAPPRPDSKPTKS
jgi:hypothetical protein